MSVILKSLAAGVVITIVFIQVIVIAVDVYSRKHFHARGPIVSVGFSSSMLWEFFALFIVATFISFLFFRSHAS
jgi:hypothetical protein